MNLIGQEKVKNVLSAMIESSKSTGKPIGHLLFCGNSGLGKTYFARETAKLLGKVCIEIVGGALRNQSALSRALKDVEINRGGILFIDEIHNLPLKIEEMLYSVMTDYIVYFYESGKIVKYEMTPFTIIGATTTAGELTKPLRDRFLNVLHFEYYTIDELVQVIKKSYPTLDDNIAYEIASRSQGTPRIAKKYLDNIINYSIAYNQGVIDNNIMNQCFADLSVDIYGLDDNSRKILMYLSTGKSAGIDNIILNLSLDKNDVLNIYEPYLVYKQYIERTPKGRTITDEGLKVLGIIKESPEITGKNILNYKEREGV